MAVRTDSEKRFDRFFVIVIIVAILTVVLTYSTTYIENRKMGEEMQDSLAQPVVPPSGDTIPMLSH